MKSYAKNSPEAMARVLAMTMITDASLDDRELEVMERLRLYDLLGLSKARFSRVVEDYCEDLLRAGAPDSRVDLLDAGRIETVTRAVDDPKKRLLTAQMVLNVLKADDRLHAAELALFRQILERWELSFDALVEAVERG
jgi:uncharacterized tellurite resistance protein B-like protein